ncbi:MAG TPA: ABC transporter substrate-binding protein [Thermomicrobiales bacterium]|nr:ABC transporter substrate-binding protein [Thermomicrobiales bacterium]
MFSRRAAIAATAGAAGFAALPNLFRVAAQERASGGRITFGISYDTAVFDQLTSGTSPLASPWVFENLVIRAEDGSYQPWVAESWETSEDGLELTFKIRPGVTFHDGTPLDANAVKWFYDAARDPEGQHIFSNSYASVSDIVVDDDLTVRFVFSAPSVAFLDTIASSFAGIISPTAYEEAGDNYGVNVVVGSGPLKFSEWTPNDTMVLVRNEDYAWAPASKTENAGPALIDEAVVRVIPEAATAIASLEADELDVLYGMPVQDYGRLREDDRFTFLTRPKYGGALLHLKINHGRPVFGDVNVRRAFNHAIDREGIAAAIYQNIAGEAAYGYLPPHFPAHFPDAKSIGYQYDPEEARRLLDAAGFTASDDGTRMVDGAPLVLKMISTNRSDEMAVAQVIQTNLSEIGVQLEIEMNTPTATFEYSRTGEFDFYLALWGWGSPDILNSSFATGADSNRSGISDPELDKLLADAVAAPSMDELNAGYAEADKYLIENAMWVPLIFQTDLIAVRTRVHGFEFNALGDPSFPTAWSVDN